MLQKKLCLVVTFDATAAAMAAEKYCLERGVPGRLIPVPRGDHRRMRPCLEGGGGPGGGRHRRFGGGRHRIQRSASGRNLRKSLGSAAVRDFLRQKGVN